MPIVIDIKLNATGRSSALDKLVSRLKALEAQLDRVNAKLLMMNSIVNSIGNNAAGMRMPALGGRGGGGGRAPAVRKPPIIKAPKQPPTMGQKMRNLIFSTRVGMDQSGKLQIAPLVGRLAQLHPALAVAATGLSVFAAMLNTAKNALLSFATSAAVMGGSPKQTAAANRAAKMIGMDPQSASSRLRAAIEGGGVGAGFAAQAGINTVGGPFGDNNYSAKLIKALDYIANAPNIDTARRRAEGLGLEEAAAAFFLDAQSKAKLGRAGEPRAQADVQSAMKLQIATVELQSAWEKLSITVMSGIMPKLTKFLNLVNDVSSAFSGFAKAMSSVQFAYLSIIDALSWLRDMINSITGKGAKSADQKATEANTKAIEALNRTMNKGIYGGGDRARGALPKGLDGRQYGRDVQAAMGSGIPL